MKYRNLKEETAERNVSNGMFEKLLQKAEELVGADPSVQQAIAVLTSGGKIFCFVNHDIIAGNYTEETAFANMLVENKETCNIPCVCGMILHSMFHRGICGIYWWR